MSPPTRPNGVSMTESVEPSPMPHASRSPPVATSLRCLREQRAVGPEVEHRVVDRAAVALVDRDHQVHGLLLRDRTERVARRTRHVDRLIGPARVPLAVGPRRRAPHPIGIARYESLGERDERGAIGNRVLRVGRDLLDRGLAIEEDGGALHGGDSACHGHAENANIDAPVGLCGCHPVIRADLRAYAGARAPYPEVVE